MRSCWIIALTLAAIAVGVAVGAFLFWSGRVEFTLPVDLPRPGAHFDPAGFATATQGQRIVSIDLRLQMLHGSKRLNGEASIRVRAEGTERREFHFLLNPGLRVTAARAHGIPVATGRRATQLTVQLREVLPAGGETDLLLAYEGELDPNNLCAPVQTMETLILPWLSFWHPLDLRSYPALSYEVRMPVHLAPVLTGPEEVQSVEGGMRTVRWREQAPALGASLAAGRFTQDTRWQGGVKYVLCWPEGSAFDPIPYFQSMTSIYEFYALQFGAAASTHLCVVLAPEQQTPLHGGNALAVLPYPPAPDPFMDVARLIAQHWWGGALTGMWLSAGRDGSVWLMEGLPEFSAWMALASLRGRSQLWQYREQQRFGGGVDRPLAAPNLFAWLSGAAANPQQARDEQLRGAYFANLLRLLVGDEAFYQGVRQLFADNQYAAVPYDALRDQLAGNGGISLAATFETWLQTAGELDYAVEDVRVESDWVRLTIGRAGPLIAPIPLEIALFTTAGIEFHEVAPEGGVTRVEPSALVQRIVVDPFHRLPDRRRANNVWPRQTWPSGLRVSADGRIAVTSRADWMDLRPGRITVFHPGERVVDQFRFEQLAEESLAWSPAGPHLFIKAGRDHFLWVHGANVARLGEAQNRFAGWRGTDALLATPGAPTRWQAVRPGELPMVLGETKGYPHIGSAVHQPWSNIVAYVDAASTDIRTADFDAQTDSALAIGAAPVSNLAWRQEPPRLVYVDARHGVRSIVPPGNAVETLIEIPYTIGQARVSPSGRYAAWTGPAGNLRVADLDSPEAQYVQLSGEVVDFAWQGEAALVCLVAEMAPELPMRCHAKYGLVRVPTLSWRPERLDANLARFN